jgi:hypothetical protein
MLLLILHLAVEVTEAYVFVVLKETLLYLI